MEAFLTSVIVVIVVFGIVWLFFQVKPTDGTTTSVIVNTIRDGTKETRYTLPIQHSTDQPEGLTFSYAGWFQITDFTQKFGVQKILFAKGSDDGSIACPALLLDANSNTLLVKIDTYGSQEIIPIPNIPAKKWLHVAIAVSQDAANVYINGTLHTHHTLNQIPRQNTGPLYVSSKGGFAGRVGFLEYYPYLLKPNEVATLALTAPQFSPTDKDIGVLPPYFDSTWWITHA